jgi:acid phosphatase type 7
MKPLVALPLLALVSAALFAHQNPAEDRLLLHFATGAKPIADGRWPDLLGKVSAVVQGRPLLTNLGPAEALVCDGFSDWLLVATNLAAAQPLLPRREFSVTAWVVLNETTGDGGIAGFTQDNGAAEQGWLLGYNRRSFAFSLATKGADDGDGKITRLVGRQPVERGRWHYVAATYDGATMRLYVDGQPDGESKAQSGDILYPPNGRLALAAYVDDDERHPMDGGLYEVKAYARALTAEEIAAVARRHERLLEWRSPVNQVLKWVVAPYLQHGTSNSMTVLAETSQAARLTVEYGERQPLRQRVATTAAQLINGVTLPGLKPRTQYFYRVTAVDAQTNYARSEIATFQTFPQPAEAFAFGIIGDTQRNPDITRRCADGLFALRPNVVIHCGDVVDDGFAKPQWVYDLFEPSARLFAHVPVHPVIGNHERDAHWYYDYFHLPAPEYWYTFAIGNAQFFMVDSNKDCAPGSEQYRWLEAQLAASKATWKFTAHHHPCFSSDEDDYGDRWKGRPDEPWVDGDDNARHLVPLYEKYGVDIAFAGHIHSYERTWPLLGLSINQRQGVRYIVSGGGGGGLEQAGPQRAWYTLHVARGHHYCHAVVFDRTIQFKAYDAEGRLFDTFELTKPADR